MFTQSLSARQSRDVSLLVQKSDGGIRGNWERRDMTAMSEFDPLHPQYTMTFDVAPSGKPSQYSSEMSSLF